MMTDTITQLEKNSLLYYQGAIDRIRLDASCSHLADFYQIPDAYEVINTLLFPGIENEKARIMEERILHEELLDHMPELLQVYCNIYSAMCKYTLGQNGGDKLHTWRKDRIHTLGFLKSGCNPCFLSASFTEEISPYYHKKAGILLLEIEAPACVEHLDMNKALGDSSAYPEEEEILFAPFLHFEIEELKLNEKEKDFQDINGEAPKGKYLLHISGSTIEPGTMEDAGYKGRLQRLYDEITEPEAVENAKKILRLLQSGESPEETMVDRYDNWKQAVHAYLKLKYAEIKRGAVKVEDTKKRIKLFEEELDQYQRMTDSRRKQYKKQLMWVNIALSVLNALCFLCLSLSFIPDFDLFMRVGSLVFASGGIVVSGVCKGLALDGKWKQRTTTFLRLDELKRDFRFETDFEPDNVDRYIGRLKEIILSDNLMSEENTFSVIEYLKTQSRTKLDKQSADQ